MNCKHVEPLLPLYIGDDLGEETSQSVAAHLESCTDCARAADDYSATNHLLQRYEPPFFSDEIYADIRGQVLNEIERKSAPLWANVFPQFFLTISPNTMRWITAAVLLAISVTALYLSRNRAPQVSDDQQVAGATQEAQPNQPDKGANVRSQDNNGSEASVLISKKGTEHTSPRDVSVIGRKKENAGGVAINRSRHWEKITKVDPRSNDRAVQRDVVTRPSSAPGPLRVEMQTRDRNIRIIWLYSEQGKPGAHETSKGT